jgi:hypothetical protein
MKAIMTAFQVLFVSFFGFVGCATVEAPADEPTIEEPVTEEPAVVEEPEASIPVDRADRPMFDEEGNPLSIEERIEAAEQEE